MRRRAMVLLALAFVVCAVLAAHSALAGGHMGGGSMGGGAMGGGAMGGDSLAMCLAVAETAAAVFVAATLLGPRPRLAFRLTGRSERRPARSDGRDGPRGRARDGPDLQVFLI